MEIKALFVILISTIFINNYVLSQILGCAPSSAFPASSIRRLAWACRIFVMVWLVFTFSSINTPVPSISPI